MNLNAQHPSWLQSDAMSVSSEDNVTPEHTSPAAYATGPTGNFLTVPGYSFDQHQQHQNQQNQQKQSGKHSSHENKQAQANVARLGSKVNNLIENIAMNEQKREMVVMEWQWLAILLDRIFLIFFLSSLIIMTSYFFIAGYFGG